ncbi:MAG: phage virion morphogenesis protein [Nitrosomonadales bacterium]|nr:phage virion morphogenesis protein [Nitrosomonadales bacterium]
MSDLAPLESWCADLLANLQPAARRSLARQIAASVRTNQAKRIAAQLNPDGTPYEPRKTQTRQRAKKGRIRRAMFAKLRTSRLLKTAVTPDNAVIKFAGQVQRIAEVHHFGLRDKVNRRRGPEVQYPVRELLGVTDADTELVESLVLKHLAR